MYTLTITLDALTVKLWVALVTALASFAVAIFTQFSSRSNARDIEQLRHKLNLEASERDAKRDYVYEARKRLYHECGPILFQLGELSEAAWYRITGLAETAKAGNLEPNAGSFLRDSYYRISTLYRLLAPSAALKIIQRRLTVVDCSLDRQIRRQYLLARQVFFAFGDDFAFARLGEQPLRYEPFDEDADSKARTDPATYSRQGWPLGAMEPAIEALLHSSREGEDKLITYAECEREYEKKSSRVRQTFDEIAFLVDDFHPRSRPVFWRILVTQACLYRAISRPNDLAKDDWACVNLSLPSAERTKFDWRSDVDISVKDIVVFEPFKVAEQYLLEQLAPRLVDVIDSADRG